MMQRSAPAARSWSRASTISAGAGVASAGFGIDWGKLVTHMLTIKGIYGREMFETWNAMCAMLQTSATLRDAIGRVIAEVVPARDWERGFAAAESAGTGKIILDWTEL